MAPRRESRRELAQGRAAAATLASGGSANARRSGRPRPGAAAAGALTVPSTALLVAIDEVASRDPVVADLVAHIGLISHRPRDPDEPFGALVRAIVFQQLAGRQGYGLAWKLDPPPNRQRARAARRPLQALPLDRRPLLLGSRTPLPSDRNRHRPPVGRSFRSTRSERAHSPCSSAPGIAEVASTSWLQFKGFDVSMRRRLSRYVFCSSTPRLAEWLDDVVAEVFVDDGGVAVGDLRSFVSLSITTA